jgi:hypothetical protein
VNLLCGYRKKKYKNTEKWDRLSGSRLTQRGICLSYDKVEAWIGKIIQFRDKTSQNFLSSFLMWIFNASKFYVSQMENMRVLFNPDSKRVPVENMK